MKNDGRIFGTVNNRGFGGGGYGKLPYISEAPSFRATQQVIDEVCESVSSDCRNCISKCACDESFSVDSFPYGGNYGFDHYTKGE